MVRQRFRTSSWRRVRLSRPRTFCAKRAFSMLACRPSMATTSCALTGQLDGVQPLQAAQIEHAESSQGLIGHVRDDLHDSPQVNTVPDELGVEFRMVLVEGVKPIPQTDVVGRPVAKAAADFPPLLLHLLGVQGEPLSV